MCDSSWASTPSSSTRFIFSSRPVVTAMAACWGLRPVAKALGAGSSTMYTRGLGRPLAMHSPSTRLCRRWYSCGSAGLARLTAERDGVGLPVRGERDRAGEDEGDEGAGEAVPDQAADGRPDEGQEEDEPGDERDASTTIRTDEIEHDDRQGNGGPRRPLAPSSRQAVRTRSWAPRGPPRRPRSTHASRTSTCWRR